MPLKETHITKSRAYIKIPKQVRHNTCTKSMQHNAMNPNNSKTNRNPYNMSFHNTHNTISIIPSNAKYSEVMHMQKPSIGSASSYKHQILSPKYRNNLQGVSYTSTHSITTIDIHIYI